MMMAWLFASYSNGSQSSLGKIILANFATPKGLRQIGDSSFLETSESGAANVESQVRQVLELLEQVLWNVQM